ncbi:tRNA 2-thiouridine(34) synthase MnmA [Candidatus Gracilibacteria bacterium]|nr:tRNA 2-thiouridine(34) synthase MnmA [Candidatus Gracilibacteria bacterium]
MKILCAISGGVDSAVAAHLLQKRGYEVVGIHLNLFDGENSEAERAREVAAKLKIPFYILNFREDFKKKVIANFLKNYAGNRTPNPCVICNREIKFGKLLTKMRELKCEKLATGHFARIRNGRLLRGMDTEKDQSYFLCRLTAAKFSKIIFPLGGLKKNEVKKIAKKIGMENRSEAKESAGICFLTDGGVDEFLLKNLPKKLFRRGKIRALDGKIVGEHRGLPLYTIGQRRGVELGGMHEPFFVASFNSKKNELLVAPNVKLFGKKLRVKNLSWLNSPPRNSEKILAQIRYRSPAASGIIFFGKTGARFEFDSPQRAIMPGQTVAFFQGKTCLGGGEIY